MDMILSILVGAVAFYIGGRLLEGVRMESFIQAIIVALVISILDVTLGTILKIVTLGIFSLGIFSWILNAILIQIADWFLPKFEVKNFWWALGLAAIVSIATSVLSSFI